MQLLLALQRLLVAMGSDAAAANSFVVPVRRRSSCTSCRSPLSHSDRAEYSRSISGLDDCPLCYSGMCSRCAGAAVRMRSRGARGAEPARGRPGDLADSAAGGLCSQPPADRPVPTACGGDARLHRCVCAQWSNIIRLSCQQVAGCLLFWHCSHQVQTSRLCAAAQL
jgi:hypothetical protein